MSAKRIAAAAVALSTFAVSQVHAQEWTGFYVGVNAGQVWGDARFTSRTDYGNPLVIAMLQHTAAVDSTGTRALNATGFLGGLQLGSNWQSRNWVFGLEADIQGSTLDMKDEATASFTFAGSTFSVTQQLSRSLDFFGTVRARAGVLLTPSLLAYGTGGLAYGRTTTEINGSTSYAVNSPPWNYSSSAWQTGWTAGGGIEFRLSRDLSLKGEYLYFDLGSAANSIVTYSAGGSVETSGHTVGSRFDGHIARVGLNLKLN